MISVSVITPTFETSPTALARTWASLKRQTFANWHWVVWDDSHSNNVWQQLWGFAADERYRIEAHRSMVPTGGNIGLVKHRLGMVATGDIIVELDHDDELTEDCLEGVVTAFDDPDVGFVYSDWCEINAQGQSCRYPDGWAFGYGSDYWDEEHGVWAMRAPEVNQTTLRHIVSMPNHVRAWRSSVYRKLGGHNPSLPVADDYELCVRTCLATKIVHIPKMLYKQHIGPTTAQRSRNAQIQALVKQISKQYSPQIDQYHTT